MILKHIGMIAILLASVAVLGCVSEESPAKAPSTQTTQAVTPIVTQTSPAELNLKVGETAKTSKIEVTVVAVQKTQSYSYLGSVSGDTYVENAKPGKIFILADAEIKNVGSDNVLASTSDFSVTDSDGYKYDSEVYMGDDGLKFQELYSNQRTRGKILFEVPQSASGLITV